MGAAAPSRGGVRANKPLTDRARCGHDRAAMTTATRSDSLIRFALPKGRMQTGVFALFVLRWRERPAAGPA